MVAPKNVLAIANFARKYGVDCATCHDPAVPRLNAFGHQFRKMGYRMDTEIGKDTKPQEYKEIGDWISTRFRIGYAHERFSDEQASTSAGNRFRSRNGFLRPDATVFYAGTLTKNLSTFIEIEWADEDEIELQAFMEWFQGDINNYYTLRLGQMHTLSRVGWAGFDRPTGITTPDALSQTLTGSPVPFKIGNDQRGLDFSYAFTPENRLILGVYNGMNQSGSGTSGNGQGFGDSDGSKDGLFAYEQMFGESGFTLFGYYGTWQQAAGTVVNSVTLPDDGRYTEFNFYRVGATGSWVFPIFDKKKVGDSELQGGYIYAKDEYPVLYPTRSNNSAHAFWIGAEQRLPHGSAIFYRHDLVARNDGADNLRHRNTLGSVYTVQKYLRLSIELFQYDQTADSYGVNFQAMLNY